ncbi:MAG: hypothetical protein ACRC7S_06575 [Cetobacterium sp.]
MAIQFITYDDSHMLPGKFYIPQVNMDLATALVEVNLNEKPFQTIEFNFENKKYIETSIPNGITLLDIKLFETIRSDDDFEVEVDMTHSFSFTHKHNKKTGESIVYTQSNESISGRLIVIYK